MAQKHYFVAPARCNPVAVPGHVIPLQPSHPGAGIRALRLTVIGQKSRQKAVPAATAGR